MKKLALVLAFASVSVFAASRVARAEIGTADQVPAATLLLPYFEVDLANPNAINTTFTVNNASATAVLAHVTLWTDEGIPTFNFNIYLTGYDIQPVDLGKLFTEGTIPVTASAGQDPTDTISNQGPLSQDINFASCTGVLPGTGLTPVELTHVRRSHTGRRSDVLNGCVGAQYGDMIARGYVTVDTVNNCTQRNPDDAGYLSADITFQNALFGDYTIQSSDSNFSVSEALVHIEACAGASYIGYVGNGAGLCPLAAGDYTFYGRLNGFTATDSREALATTFATRYINGNGADGSDLLVWRDPKVPPTGVNGKHHCVNTDVGWFPLPQTDVVSFDEQENPSDLCTAGSCFPLATQRVPTATGNPLGDPLATPSSFGWLFLNLNHGGGAALTGIAQAWVVSTQSSQGRFSVGFDAIALDNATGS